MVLVCHVCLVIYIYRAFLNSENRYKMNPSQLFFPNGNIPQPNGNNSGSNTPNQASNTYVDLTSYSPKRRKTDDIPTPQTVATVNAYLIFVLMLCQGTTFYSTLGY